MVKSKHKRFSQFIQGTRICNNSRGPLQSAPMVKVKICGTTGLDDAMAAVQAGADAVGFVFYAKSSRAVAPKTAAEIISRLPASVVTVGPLVNEDLSIVRRTREQSDIRLAQPHGEESVLRRPETLGVVRNVRVGYPLLVAQAGFRWRRVTSNG